MPILAVRIGLPDFDARSRDWFSRATEHTAHDIEQLCSCFPGAAQPRELPCKIGTFGHRIEWADNLRGRDLQATRAARRRRWGGGHSSHRGSLMFASLTTFAQCSTWPRIALSNS